MGELVKALKHFVTRDLVYLVGGGAVLSSFLYLFDRLPLGAISTPLALLGAGISYVVGYAIQDGFSLTPLVTTQFLPKPPPLVQWLYQRFTHREWKAIGEDLELAEWNDAIATTDDDWRVANYQRLITLKQVGTTGGSNGLVASVLLAIKAFLTGAPFDIALAAGGLGLSVLLLGLGWIKAAQQTEFLARAGPTLSPTAPKAAPKLPAGDANDAV